ncbi:MULTISPECIES: hypothetical protein [unclassified Acidiphilium]|uniref:hypothetical protein n=1 Tax=unclassified Acidiphilium TaxID=2617493 RepID=UPI000BC53502|nr:MULTISPECIES: hypothetical protein [unclassified Acidiphilium]OZB22293.1 MAG: hypothetical protein B7X49_17160 [Acidiphilium sp. 34-64-41]
MSTPFTVPNLFTSIDDLAGLVWLCEMASIGCVHANRSKWAATLADQAREIRRMIADQMEAA